MPSIGPNRCAGRDRISGRGSGGGQIDIKKTAMSGEWRQSTRSIAGNYGDIYVASDVDEGDK